MHLPSCLVKTGYLNLPTSHFSLFWHFSVSAFQFYPTTFYCAQEFSGALTVEE